MLSHPVVCDLHSAVRYYPLHRLAVERLPYEGGVLAGWCVPQGMLAVLVGLLQTALAHTVSLAQLDTHTHTHTHSQSAWCLYSYYCVVRVLCGLYRGVGDV